MKSVMVPEICGETYEPERDCGRLTSQHERLLDIMKDGKARTLQEMKARMGADLTTGLAARCRGFRRKANGGHVMIVTNIGGGTWTYRLVLNGTDEWKRVKADVEEEDGRIKELFGEPTREQEDEALASFTAGPSIPINTFSGKLFNLWEATPKDICIKDIAHALSLQCRFNGHCSEFYSVAQHSIMVARAVSGMTDNPGLWLSALLHDASEAYLGDVIKPLKVHLPEYAKIEARVMELIEMKWDVGHHNPLIKRADRCCLWYEANNLMPTGVVENFRKVCGPPPPNEVKYYYMEQPDPPTLAETRFRNYFKHIQGLIAYERRP